jgi:hypothetical protein
MSFGGVMKTLHIPAIHQELKRKGLTKQLLWEEYTQQYSGSQWVRLD